MRFHSTDDLAFAVAGALVADPEIGPDPSAESATMTRRTTVWALAATLVGLAAVAFGAAAYLRRPTVEAMPVKLNVDRKSTRLNSSHPSISYAVFCLKKKTKSRHTTTTPVTG